MPQSKQFFLAVNVLIFLLSLAAQITIFVFSLSFFTCSVELICVPQINFASIMIGLLFLVNDFFYARTYIFSKGKVLHIVKYINYLLAITAIVILVLFLKTAIK